MASEQDKARKMLRDAIGGETKSSRSLTPIAYPVRGVSETYAYSDQAPETSRDEKNMRSFDPHTGRLRGSQRAGLGKYGNGVAVDGTTDKKIGLIASVTREINPYVWSHNTIPQAQNDGAGPGIVVPDPVGARIFPASASENCTDIRRDFFGTYYILGEYGDVHITNEDGVEVGRIDAPIWEDAADGSPGTLFAETVAVDMFQNVFVATGTRRGNDAESRSNISCYEHKADGTWGRVWDLGPGIFILDMVVYGADLFVWGYLLTGATHEWKLFRYPSYKFSEAPTIDDSSTWVGGTVTPGTVDGYVAGVDDDFVGRMVVEDDGTVYATATRYASVGTLDNTYGVGMVLDATVAKLRPISPTASDAVWQHSYDGSEVNTYDPTLPTTTPGGTNDVIDAQGYGHGIALAPRVPDTDLVNGGARKLWLWGGGHLNDCETSKMQPKVRLMVDTPLNGLQFDADTAGTAGAPGAQTTECFMWSPNQVVGGNVNQHHRGFQNRNRNSRGAVDEDGYLYLPVGLHSDVSGIVNTFCEGASLIVMTYTPAGGSSVSGNIDAQDMGSSTWTINHCQKGFVDAFLQGVNYQFDQRFYALYPSCVAVPNLHPKYQDGHAVTRTNKIYMGFRKVATSALASDKGMIAASYTLVKGLIQSDSIREMKTIALVNRRYYRLNDSVAGASILLTAANGNAVYSSVGSKYHQAAVGNGHIYMTDGEKYLDFNPQDNSLNGLFSDLHGEIPKRARLIEFWRNRLVLARTDNVPGTWHMSRGGDVNDWNQFPQTPDSQMAVSGTTAPAGKCPDSINCIVPYSDDLLWLGCDSSIWQLSGDPTTATFDMITDEIGMSWGRPFCKDDVGVLWFFGSKGGLYTYDNGLVDVARGKIRRRLRDIDLGVNYVRLVYNHADDGIHIFVCPFGESTAEPSDHYFYDRRTESFHIDRFGVSGNKMEPTSAVVIDGDAPADRAVLVGTGNGHVQMWGRDDLGVIPKSDQFTNSETVAIDSYVLIGPIADVHDISEAALSELAVVLAPNYSGVHIEVFSTDTPDNLGDPVWQGEIHAGRNANQLVRISGDSIYIRFRNASADQHWSLEKCSAILSYGGQIRSDT